MRPGLPARSNGAGVGTCMAGSSRRDIVLLGSTGSIGTQAADIVRRNPGRFRVAGLAAGGGNPALLASQALEFGAEVVAVASERAVSTCGAGGHCAGRGRRAGRPGSCRSSWPARTRWPRWPPGPATSC